MNPSILALTTAVLCLAASGVHAEEPAPAGPPRHFLVLETYAFSGTLGGQTTTVVSPGLFASFGVSERVNLDAGWTFAYAPSRDGIPSALQAGNPFVGASTVLRGGDLMIRAGGVVSLPFTLLTNPDAQETAVLMSAAAMRGYNGLGLFAPGLLSVVPWADAAWRHGRLRLGVDARTPLSIQTSSQQEQHVDVVLQIAGYAGLEVLSNLLVGSNLQAIYVPTMPQGADPTYLAVIPFVRLHGSAGFVEARLNLNLDAPLGFAFDRNAVWAFGLTLGTGF